MLIQELELEDRAHVFQETYLESFGIHLLTKMYCFKHRNHDIVLSSLFQNIYKLFLGTRNLNQ